MGYNYNNQRKTKADTKHEKIKVKKETKPMKKQQFYDLPERDRLGRVLEGIAFYASLQKPNMSSVVKFKGEPYYIVNLGLDATNQKLAESWGLTVLPPEGNITMPYVKLKRKLSKIQQEEGRSIEDVKPDLIDTNQKPIPDTILIGNGSKVRCKFATYWYDTMGGGIGTSLYKVMVKELVEYVPQDKDFMLEEGETGFTVGESTPTTAAASKDDFADEIPFETTPSAKVVGGKKVPVTSSSIFD